MTRSTAGGDRQTFAKEYSVPVMEAIGYCHVGVDPAYEPFDCYWIPVADEELAETTDPPHGEVIQYPKDDREPSRVGYDEVPDAVENWDYREEDDK